MPKVSEEARNVYTEKVKEYKKDISVILAEENKISLQLKKGVVEDNPKRLSLVQMNLKLISYYVLLNNLSISLLDVKHESGLNNARKCCYKILIYMEEIVSRHIDSPFSEYEENLESIKDFSDIKKYNLVKKLGFSISFVENGFGKNSKWKWSFVEIKGRYSVVVKNLINLKTMLAGTDPRVEGYRERRAHFELAKTMLMAAANSHREKYELSTRRMDDMQLAINYLSALRRILIVVGNIEEAEIAKKKVEIWKNKMEADLKKKRNQKN